MAGKNAQQRKAAQRAREKAAREAEGLEGDLEVQPINRRIPNNPIGGSWQKETLELWHAIKDTQIAQRMIDTDWRWLEMLLPQIDRYWRLVREDNPQALQILAKLRIELAELGFTPKARKALMWHFLPPGATPKQQEPEEGPPLVEEGDRGNVVSIHKLSELA